ncbi:MAG: heme-binding protein, partial [Thermoanaerobaculia bacterium]|nr:heme-binding protein [Thermoanaerobaculia bacterium]
TFVAGAFEVRDYPALLAAEVTERGDRDQAATAGFRRLAANNFGGNTRRRSLAMTTPVVQAPTGGQRLAMTAPVVQSGQPGSWLVRFLMPRGYTLETLPVPHDPRVRLLMLPPARFAVVRFSGLARSAEVERQTTLLRAFAADQDLSVTGSAALARYNPPWTLWFLRRNEVLLPLAPTTSP